MLEKFSQQCACWLIQKGADQCELEIYAYAIECALSSAVAYALLLMTGIIMGRIVEMLLWLVFWISLRTNLGGLHASSHGVCLLLTTAIGAISILLIPYVSISIMPIGLLFSIIITFASAPVIHKNHPISARRISQARKVARITVVIQCVIITALYMLTCPYIAAAAFCGTFAASLLGGIGKLCR